jgi:hypothetical protein
MNSINNTIWNDENRFNQTGYSAPTRFPDIKNYDNPLFYLQDRIEADRREQSHQEWLEEERFEARMNGER